MKGFSDIMHVGELFKIGQTYILPELLILIFEEEEI